MIYKLMYLARRNPALAREDFPEAWREHSRLGSKFATSLGPYFIGIKQCARIWDADLPESFAGPHDGSAMASMKSLEDMDASQVHPRAVDEMRKDEERVFSDYVFKSSMTTEEHVIVDQGQGDVVLLSFLARRPEVDEDAFKARLAAVCDGVAAVAGEHPNLRRFVVDHVLKPGPAPYEFAAVLELWFDTQAQAELAAREPAVLALLEQSEIAAPSRGVRLAAKISYEKRTAVSPSGETIWQVITE